MGDCHDDDFAGIKAVVNGERKTSKDAFLGVRAAGPAFRRFADFLDGGTDDTQKIVTSTGALLVVAIGTTV